MNANARSHEEITAIEKPFRNFAAPTITPHHESWPAFRRQIRLVCAQDRHALGISQIEADTVLAFLFLRNEIELDINILIAVQSTARISFRRKDTHGNKCNALVSGGGVSVPKLF